MKTNNSKTLTSLALIETQLLSQDYLSTFLPFIATLVLKKEYKNVDIGIVVNDFKEEYGIDIPRAPMQSILSKAVSNGLITSFRDGTYLPVLSEMKKISFLTEQNQNKAKISSLLTYFIEFTEEKHKVLISLDEAVDIFINFLDEYSPKTISGEYNGVEGGQSASNRDLFLMGQFIQSTLQTNFSLFETIRKLAMAYLITTAITFDQPVEARVSSLSGITIYLDTPVVLRLLGLQSEELENAYKEMFESFKLTINPTFMIFQHTMDEISGIIADCAKWIDNAAYNPNYANPALLNFIKRKFNKTQVELYRSTLTEKLHEIGITVDDLEYYKIESHRKQIDVDVFRNKLIETYKKNNLQFEAIRNESSITFDIRSIENIVKLWGRKSAREYKTLGYLFLTSNSTLAYVSRKFTSEYWWDNKHHKTPCITDYYLGTMVWLSTPADKVENVSKLKLLADCSAATTLSKEILEKFSFELKKLEQFKGIKDSDYLLLRNNAFEKNYLQNLTLNDEMAFKDDIIDQLLDDIKADIQKPLIETIQEKELQLDKLQLENAEQNKRIQLFEQEKQRVESDLAAEELKIEEKAEKTAKRIINTFAPIAVALFSFIAALLQLISTLSNWVILIKIISAIVALGSAIFIGIMKSNIFGAYGKLTMQINKKYKVRYYKEKL